MSGICQQCGRRIGLRGGLVMFGPTGLVEVCLHADGCQYYMAEGINDDSWAALTAALSQALEVVDGVPEGP